MPETRVGQSAETRPTNLKTACGGRRATPGLVPLRLRLARARGPVPASGPATGATPADGGAYGAGCRVRVGVNGLEVVRGSGTLRHVAEGRRKGGQVQRLQPADSFATSPPRKLLAPRGPWPPKGPNPTATKEAPASSKTCVARRPNCRVEGREVRVLSDALARTP